MVTTVSHNSQKIRHLTGVVVSAANAKTRVVTVSRLQAHQKYGKRFAVSQRFHAHDEQNSTAVGDRVEIVACRPLSRLKRWRIIRKLS